MKKITSILLLLSITILFFGVIYDNDNSNVNENSSFVFTQDSLDKNNISCTIWNSGIIDLDMRTNNTPGFQWPKGSGKFAIFTAGLTIAGYVNTQLRFAAASYRGEYEPGYCTNGIFHTNNNFKIYKVTRGDNLVNNPDWLNWGLMVSYGAPYNDVNHNGIYEPAIDTPGLKGAAQTIFLCMTDADPTSHTSSEGFGGGTTPLGAEVHLTAWCYDNPGYEDMQFFKWVILNKNISSWDSVKFSITSDPDLGNPNDDYLGCDTVRNLGYVYNSDNMDGDGTGYSYGLNPPAVGFEFLDCNLSNNLKMTSVCHWRSNFPVCEREPSGAAQAYNYILGFKNDRTPWVIPSTNPPITTTFNYSGDPETHTGWTEYTGKVDNCGSIYGNNIIPSPAGDRKMVMSTHSPNQRMNPGDTQVVQICQLIARGSNNLNSVTKLKQLADVAKQLCENNFVIGISPISTEIPKNFSLSQNYPNPFNPSTKIQFAIPAAPLFFGEGLGVGVGLSVYDMLGKEVSTLVNEHLKPGTYSVEWNASNYPSGVYFYKLNVQPSDRSERSDGYIETKKMVLLK